MRPNAIVLSCAVVLMVVLALPRGAATQPGPAIPERACPRVTLTLEPPVGARGMGLRITNVTPGSWPARLRAEVGVEREEGGHWVPVSTAGLLVRDRCDQAPAECVTLPIGGAVTIVPWTGMLGDAQCECTRCAPAPGGRYRFVVSACHGCLPGLRTESAPFDLAAP